MATITWTLTPTVKEVTLPSGNSYYLKDADVRNWIGTGSSSGAEYRITELESAVAALENATHWLGITTTTLTDGSTTNPITIGGESVTAVSGDIVQDSNGIEFIFNGTAWQQFGASIGTLRAFAFADTGTVTITPAGTNDSSAVSFEEHTVDSVLGADTTFTAQDSAVSFGQHTVATVLTSSVTATVPKATGTSKYLTASASGGAVSVTSSGNAITALGNPTVETFVKSYPGDSSKLELTEVTGVTASTTTASRATAGTAIAVATTGTSVSLANGSLGTETSTRGANTPMWGATVSDEVLSFTFKPIEVSSITPAVSNGTITPYTFESVDVPIKASSATTVATGSISSSGDGDSVLIGLGTPTTDSGVTGYSPSVSQFAQEVSMTTQPSVSLTANTTTSSGAVEFISAVANSGTNAVTFDTTTSGTTASAITALGTATAAGQQISANTDDLVSAITALGAATAGAQTFHGTEATHTVYPTSST